MQEDNTSFIKSPYLVAVVLLTVFTNYLIGIYGAVHWDMWALGPHPGDLGPLRMFAAECLDAEGMAKYDYFSQALQHSIKQSHETAGKTVHRLEFYRVTGLLSFVFSVIALFRIRNWLKILLLPLGLYSGFLAIIIM